MSLKLSPRTAGILASGFILYTILFVTVVLKRGLSLEVLFVSVIWLTAGDSDAYESARKLTREVEQGATISPTERIRYTRESSPVHVLIAGAPVFIQGESRGVAAVYTNIEKRKKAETEVQRMLSEKPGRTYHPGY